ncbi:hypothetical protein A3F02_03655 [Candidatus Curtissbacteria bacterium RIFCSPHIGHO2_12_FULL_38_9b]|nr:MAG: hypothetical protein A3F02_03655 [Candidatus Curtissbacteria bacterium RIFCSPHIGHO2_12_FULL_38_9b]
MDKKRDKKLIITEILNKGDDRAIRWLGANYTLQEIKEVVSSPIRGMWLSETLTYWLKILDLKLPEDVLKRSVLNLSP